MFVTQITMNSVIIKHRLKTSITENKMVCRRSKLEPPPFYTSHKVRSWLILQPILMSAYHFIYALIIHRKESF